MASKRIAWILVWREASEENFLAHIIPSKKINLLWKHSRKIWYNLMKSLKFVWKLQTYGPRRKTENLCAHLITERSLKGSFTSLGGVHLGSCLRQMLLGLGIFYNRNRNDLFHVDVDGAHFWSTVLYKVPVPEWSLLTLINELTRP